MFNPYYQQMPQFQQPQQFQFPQNNPNTKTVNSFDEVTANDVPMNTPYTVFVKSDLSEVQLRHWNASGQIESMTYNAIKVQAPKNPETEELREEIRKLSNKVEDLSRMMRGKRNESAGNT